MLQKAVILANKIIYLNGIKMISRLIISILLLPLLFFAIYLDFSNYIYLYILIFVISIIANFELSRLFRNSYREYLKIYEFSTYIFNFILFYSYYAYKAYNLNRAIPVILPILVIAFSIIVLIFKKTGLKQFFLFLISSVYTGMIPLLIIVIRYFKYGDLLIYLLFLMVWINDASALFVGSKFGKIKGIIRYSPNKSLEGYVGSFFITIVISIIFKLIFSEKLCFTYTITIVLSVVVSLTGHLGDILESFIKRKAGVKDSSRLFAGLGGILDIFDSVIASLPFYFLFVKLFCARG